MKKYIIIFLSTFIFVLMPSIVNAATDVAFNYYTLNWGQNTTSTATLRQNTLNLGDNAFVTFSFQVIPTFYQTLSPCDVPYQVEVILSNGNISSCTLSSVYYTDSTNQPEMQNGLLISAFCPVALNNVGISSVKFYRLNNNSTDTVLRLPDRLMVYSNGEFSSVVTAQQQTTNAVNNVNNSINNDSVSTNTENSDTASSWASASASDSVVSDMVLMPITLLNAFSSGFSGSCQTYNLGSLYGTNLTLPCINIQNYLGSTLWGIIDVLMSGFLIYGIGKKFVRVFNDFTNLKDSQVDELYGGGNE